MISLSFAYQPQNNRQLMTINKLHKQTQTNTPTDNIHNQKTKRKNKTL